MIRGHLVRLVTLEYAPLIGNTLLWSQVVVHLGAKPAATLLAANLCTLAAVNLTVVVTRGVVHRRRHATPAVWRATLRMAWGVEALSALAGMATMLALVLAYDVIGRSELAVLALIQIAGLPARYNGPVRERTRFGNVNRLVRAWGGALLVGGVLLAGGGAREAAAALALREWLATGIAALLPGHRDIPDVEACGEAPRLAEFAASTAQFNARRMAYRIGKSLLSMILGPAGGLIARTSRGMRLERRLSMSGPKARWSIRLIAVGASGGALLFPALVKGPGALVVGATLLRIGFSALSALFWLRHAGDFVSPDDDEDDDD